MVVFVKRTFICKLSDLRKDIEMRGLRKINNLYWFHAKCFESN